MTNPRGVFSQSIIGCTLLLLAGCSGGSGGGGSSGGAQGGQSSTGTGAGGSGVAGSSASAGQMGGASSSSSQAAGQAAGATSSGQAGKGGGQTTGTGGQGGKATTGGRTGGNTDSGDTGGAASGGQVAGATGGSGGTAAAGTTGTTTGGKSGGSSGQAGSTGSGGQTGGGGVVSGCVNGKAWPTANPTAAGPFKVLAEKKVGPLAGALPDPIYGDEQQRFNIYRPENLADSGYCHPILIWANGYKDNPEQNPPKCIVNRSDQWCGQYSPILNHLASHGFVVMASLSTTTGSGNPLPTIVGLNWLLEQAEDSSSPYYHRLDTANIGAFGHSMGGMSTCKSASEPRYKALATICGTSALSGVHTPMLFFCGGADTMVECPSVKNTFLTVKDQPAFFMNELKADHGSWVYGGPNSPSLSSAAAWFRVHLMGDTANRKYFYGKDCTFCSDSRVQVEQNSLMTQ